MDMETTNSRDGEGQGREGCSPRVTRVRYILVAEQQRVCGCVYISTEEHTHTHVMEYYSAKVKMKSVKT